MSSTTKSPIYKLIKQEIRSSILASELLPGDVLPTRSEFAAKYSTTQATVNKAFNDLTLEGLIASKRGKRTVVLDSSAANAPAASASGGRAPLRRPDGKEKEIAVVWSVSEELVAAGADYYGPLMQGIRSGCAVNRLDAVFRASDVSNYGNVLVEAHSSGLIVLVPNFEDLPAFERLHAEGVPIVAVPGIHGGSTIPDVTSDHRDGIRQAVRHLVELGHTDIGFVSMTVALPDHFERMKGFLDAMEEFELAVHPHSLLLESRVHLSRFARCINAWARPGKLPTAIITGDFLMAMALMRRLRELGVDVPGDVSVVHFDDPAAAAHMHPPTTAVAQNVSRLGEIAVSQLVRLMNDEPVELVVKVPTTLIVRESTAPPRDLSGLSGRLP